MRKLKWILVAFGIVLSFFAGRWSVTTRQDAMLRTAVDNEAGATAISPGRKEREDSRSVTSQIVAPPWEDNGVRLINRRPPSSRKMESIDQGMKADELERKNRLQEILDGGGTLDPASVPADPPFIELDE